MPSRNILKYDVANSYYHIYARGNNKQKIFIDNDDYVYFTKLLARYLSKSQRFNNLGVPYPHLYGKLELLCYCLMPNHFHLLCYQKTEKAMSTLMRGVMTSYSRYFNTKYNRTGSLFESRYKASHIDSQSYLDHISRYIHLNRKDWEETKYSSIGHYLGDKRSEWVLPERIMQLFNSKTDYKNFLIDYQDHKEMLDIIKYELANNITPYY
jgi:putative transposase